MAPTAAVQEVGNSRDKISVGVQLLDLITRRRNVVFGHIARLSKDTPAHQALRCHVNLSLGHLPDQGWRRRPGRPSNRWIDQIRRDNNNILICGAINRARSFGGDATVLADYALTTTRGSKLYNLVPSGHFLFTCSDTFAVGCII